MVISQRNRDSHFLLDGTDWLSFARYSIWQSYLENNTPSAGRIFWVYGPEKNQITVIGIEPHPEDKKRGGYDKVKLSELPE